MMSAAKLRGARQAPVAAAEPRRSLLGLAVFPSALGWMAITGAGDVPLRLTFGHASHDEALVALRRDREFSQLEDSSESMAWNPPLVQRLQAYAEGTVDDFLDVPIDTSHLSEFQRRVIEHCRRIRHGQTRTYGELAALAGSPGAARAVGNVMSANGTPLIVPCHRVVAAGGELGNYSAGGGRRMKLRLLESEAAGTQCGSTGLRHR